MGPAAREERTSLAMLGPQEGAPAIPEGSYCLRMRGVGMWNLCDLMLEQEVKWDEPTYLMADWHGHGPVGQMTVMLHIEGESQPVYFRMGPVGRLAVDRWDKLVARLDQFDPALAGRALTVLRLAARCTVGAETGGGPAPEPDLYLDNVRIVTGAETAQAVDLAEAMVIPEE